MWEGLVLGKNITSNAKKIKIGNRIEVLYTAYSLKQYETM